MQIFPLIFLSPSLPPSHPSKIHFLVPLQDSLLLLKGGGVCVASSFFKKEKKKKIICVFKEIKLEM